MSWRINEDRKILSKIVKDYTIPPEQLYIHDEELCPCGSGKQYKICCKGKQDAQMKASPKPVEIKMVEQLRKDLKNYHCCLHPDKTHCTRKIKEAHALQNNKILSLLCGSDNHVMIQDHEKSVQLLNQADEYPIPIIPFSRKGRNKATTQNCFCDYHDTVVFRPIEAGAPSFDPANEEMTFIYAYKAFIFEYSKQSFLMGNMRRNFSLKPNTFSIRELVAEYRIQCMRMEEMEPIKKHYDSELLAGTHNGVFTHVTSIPYRIGMACYAYVGLDYDLNGQRIENIDSTNKMHRVSITILPENNISYILLSCLENEKQYYNSLFQQLSFSPLNKVLFYFNMMLPLYSENLVLSEELWNKLGADGQQALTFMANLYGPKQLEMSNVIGMGLRNAARDTRFNYSTKTKLNLFMNTKE